MAASCPSTVHVLLGPYPQGLLPSNVAQTLQAMLGQETGGALQTPHSRVVGQRPVNQKVGYELPATASQDLLSLLGTHEIPRSATMYGNPVLPYEMF